MERLGDFLRAPASPRETDWEVTRDTGTNGNGVVAARQKGREGWSRFSDTNAQAGFAQARGVAKGSEAARGSMRGEDQGFPAAAEAGKGSRGTFMARANTQRPSGWRRCRQTDWYRSVAFLPSLPVKIDVTVAREKAMSA